MDYWRAITPIEAQKILMDLNIASYPHMSAKGGGRKKFLSAIKKKAYSPIEKQGSGLSSMQDILAGMVKGMKRG